MILLWGLVAMRGAYGSPVLDPVFPVFSPDQTMRFAVIGDYGVDSQDEADVADLVAALEPEFIITTGDNRYAGRTFDQVVGKYYCQYLTDVEVGTFCAGGSSPTNAFFPSLGNHDYLDYGGVDAYLDYFTLPGQGVASSGTSGSERYYDFIQGPIHFFALDSDPMILDPVEMLAQQNWLQTQLAASTAPWQIVYMHHPPYSSGMHGSSIEMQWPYAQWGADFVISGHEHYYERIEADGIAYFINGLGGKSRYNFYDNVPGSMVRYNGDYGAMLVEATPDAVNFRFITRSGAIIDNQTYPAPGPQAPAPVASAPSAPLPLASLVTASPSFVGADTAKSPASAADEAMVTSVSWIVDETDVVRPASPAKTPLPGPVVDLLVERLLPGEYIADFHTASDGRYSPPAADKHDLRSPISDSTPYRGVHGNLLADILAETLLAIKL